MARVTLVAASPRTRLVKIGGAVVGRLDRTMTSVSTSDGVRYVPFWGGEVRFSDGWKETFSGGSLRELTQAIEKFAG